MRYDQREKDMSSDFVLGFAYEFGFTLSNGSVCILMGFIAFTGYNFLQLNWNHKTHFKYKKWFVFFDFIELID